MQIATVIRFLEIKLNVHQDGHLKSFIRSMCKKTSVVQFFNTRKHNISLAFYSFAFLSILFLQTPVNFALFNPFKAHYFIYSRLFHLSNSQELFCDHSETLSTWARKCAANLLLQRNIDYTSYLLCPCPPPLFDQRRE